MCRLDGVGNVNMLAYIITVTMIKQKHPSHISALYYERCGSLRQIHPIKSGRLACFHRGKYSKQFLRMKYD